MVEGNVRRLPSWMVAGNSRVVDGSKNTAKEEDQKVTTRVTKARKNKEVRRENLELEERPKSKCGVKRRKRKTSPRDDCFDNRNDKDDDNEGGAYGKKKKKKNGRLPKEFAEKVSMEESGGGCVRSMHNQVEDDDSDELTVEDLVSIAKEYVEVHEVANREQPLGREVESSRDLPTMPSSGKVNKSSPGDERGMAFVSCATKSTTNAQSLFSTVKTGDPAKDMLDLFLGPLLNKPPVEEKTAESRVKDIDFDYESVRRSQNDGREEIVPVMKKKSSLKDKVSLLLN